MVPSSIAHYEIIEKLGEGGMGAVYKARDLKLDRLVALKLLPHALSSNTAERARLLQEAKAASSLNHPHVCSIHSVGEQDGEFFIDMEFVEGRTLRSVIGGRPLDLKEAISFGLQITEALQEAHAKGIVHRDVTCDNIMVTPKQQLKVMDFGLARLKGTSHATGTQPVEGTLAYMAPEQLRGDPIDQRADLWALGVVIHEMLTGALPFRGDHEAAVMYEILNLDLKSIQSLRPDVPRHLQVLVEHLLQKDPSRRIASAAEVIDRLMTPTDAPASAQDAKSIAVLYFENISPDKESEYFCAGMTEDIITDLSKLRDVKVVSRADVLPLRDRSVNTRQAGELLRVNYVLEGSVRTAGRKMRITAQLVDVRTGFQLWAERFDRPIDDILDVQTEVSQKIVEALQVSVSASEKHSLAQKPTDDLKAYDCYMRGRDLMVRRGKKNNELAMQMFENALRIDPHFANAYAGLAEAYSYVYSWYDGDATWLGKIIAMSEKALSLDPGSAEAQLAIGLVYFHQRRLPEAKRALDRVIQKNPEHYDSLRWRGVVADVSGEYDAALAYYKRCAELKPYSEEPWMHLEMTYRRTGDSSGSAWAMQKFLEVGERKLQVNPDDATTLSRVAGTLVRAGETGKAKVALQRAIEIAPTDGLVQYNCACAYANLGDTKSAIACLQQAIHIGYRVGDWVRNDPDMDPLRDEPAFKELVAGMGG